MAKSRFSRLLAAVVASLVIVVALTALVLWRAKSSGITVIDLKSVPLTPSPIEALSVRAELVDTEIDRAPSIPASEVAPSMPAPTIPIAFEEKYKGFTTTQMEVARDSLRNALADTIQRRLTEEMEQGRFRSLVTSQGESMPPREGHLAMSIRSTTRSDGAVEWQIAEMDETTDPATRGINDELQWVSSRVKPH